MNRHFARTLAMQTLYEWDFQSDKSIDALLEHNIAAISHENDDNTFVIGLVKGVASHLEEIDKAITEHAPEWPIDQISVVDKSILRLAVYELLYTDEVPAKVSINEAVELAKTFGGDNSSRFVNGVLGTAYRTSDRGKKELSDEELAKPAAKE